MKKPVTIEARIAALEKEVSRLSALLECGRCRGSGTITDRNGELDECPICHGEPLFPLLSAPPR